MTNPHFSLGTNMEDEVPEQEEEPGYRNPVQERRLAKQEVIQRIRLFLAKKPSVSIEAPDKELLEKLEKMSVEELEQVLLSIEVQMERSITASFLNTPLNVMGKIGNAAMGSEDLHRRLSEDEELKVLLTEQFGPLLSKIPAFFLITSRIGGHFFEAYRNRPTPPPVEQPANDAQPQEEGE